MSAEQNRLVPAESSGLLTLLHSNRRELDLPEPFSRDIMLLETQIAGTSHVVGLEELEPFLKPGDRLKLVRIPSNPSDPNAIKVLNPDGLKLGYVPKQENLILARLMDGGKLLYATLTDKSWRGDWLRLFIKIYLQDD